MRPALKQSVHTWAGHADRPLTVQVSVLSVCKTLSLIPRLGEARGGVNFFSILLVGSHYYSYYICFYKLSTSVFCLVLFILS